MTIDARAALSPSPSCPCVDGWQRKAVLRLLLEAPRRKQQAIVDLRDGVVYLANVAGHP